MAEPEDLLGKADALMSRHRPQRPLAESYPEIPLLEEVVESPQSDEPPLLTELAQGPLDEESIEALATSIRAELLAALGPEIDALIEERLKESFAPRLESLIDGLRGDLQRIARETLSEAVSAALARELERRKQDT